MKKTCFVLLCALLLGFAPGAIADDGSVLSPMFYEDAAERLEALPPDFYLPLRRRLAVARKIC